MIIQKGQKSTQGHRVGLLETAKYVGSGGLEVLASPIIVTWVEEQAFWFLENNLDKDLTSVGIEFTLKHLAPSAVGALIEVEIEVKDAVKNKVTFEFKVMDGDSLVAAGSHTRAIVETVPFMSKVE